MADEWWRQSDPRSEYEGRGVQENTLFPNNQLTAGEQLRLDSLTGQNIDSRAPRDAYHWQGGVEPDPIVQEDPTPEQFWDLADPY